MKIRFFTFILLMAAGLAFAQSGLMGGTDGIHQINSKTLGKYRFSLGTGGNVTIDPWALTRGGVFYDDGVEQHLQDFKISATGNFYIGFGLADNIDVAVALPINYDRSYAEDYLEATAFECLVGYLYLNGRYERLMELVGPGMDVQQA